MTRLVYLDHAATTPMVDAAVDVMLPFLRDRFANPSGSHRFARDARRAVDEARDSVAARLGVAPGEVVFTSGGTESDNTAVVGALRSAGSDAIAVCPAAEHHAVLHPIEARGGRVVAVDHRGHVDLDRLGAALDDSVCMVSVMAVNNEVGTVTDLSAVRAVVRERAPQALLHTDAVQAASWLDLREVSAHVDALSLSAHKFGGPKGVGVLVVRDGTSVRPLLEGGGQERDRRSGTHNVAGIAALAAALDRTDEHRVDELVRISALRDRLVDGLLHELDDVVETVDRAHKVAGSAHVCIGGIESESLLFLLDEADVCASAASACASGAMEPSHVLSAMGVGPEWSAGALRMSLGASSSHDDIDWALDVIVDAVRRLRRSVSPSATAPAGSVGT